MQKRAVPPRSLVRQIAVVAIAATTVAVAVSACGGLRREQRAEWRAQAELTCLKSGKIRETPYVKISKSIDGPGVCGANYPMKISAVAAAVPQNAGASGNLILTSGNLMLTSITPTATLSCPMVVGVDAWLAGDVQRAAMDWFGQPITELITFGSFSCRPMNNRTGSRLSEHSFANAIDAKGFRLADGRVVTVLKGWRGAPEEQGFLRDVASSACRHFSTVLAPGSDAYHYDHIHVDLARHNRGMHVCRPKITVPTPGAVLSGDPLSGLHARPQPAEPPMITKPGGRSPPAQLYHGPDEGPDDVEDLRDERNFDGRKFDLTGSIPGSNDPKVVIQRPRVTKG